jgi:4-hydroxybenzoate polyprenyltransferase
MGDLAAAVRRSSDFLSFIRFSHTVFALPFALGAMFVAAGGIPPLQVMGLSVVAMVFARTAAMSFNRLADWEIDKRNPRTEGRHRLASKTTALAACVLSGLLFVVTTAFLNPLCFLLSPLALAIVFFYSFTKRFTNFAQFFLGLALSVAPVGGWLAVTGHFDLPPLLLAAAVLCWVAGFDMVYAMQDYEIDLREGLHSMVVALGIPRAKKAAIVLHLLALIGLVGFGVTASLGTIYFGGLLGIGALLIWEHRLASRGDTHAINTAFFQANAAVGLLFVLATLADAILR